MTRGERPPMSEFHCQAVLGLCISSLKVKLGPICYIYTMAQCLSRMFHYLHMLHVPTKHIPDPAGLISLPFASTGQSMSVCVFLYHCVFPLHANHSILIDIRQWLSHNQWLPVNFTFLTIATWREETLRLFTVPGSSKKNWNEMITLMPGILSPA